MARFRIARRVLTMVVVGALAGCAHASPPPTSSADPQLLTVAGVSRQAPTADAPVAGAVAGLGRFAEVFGSAVVKPGQNAVYSPLSIAYAFAMLRAAADGQTAAQLDTLFGFPGTGLHEAYNALSRGIVTTGDAPPRPAPGATRDPATPPAAPIVSIANGLFLQQGFQPTQAFLRTLAEQYGAAARAVDFGSDQATRTINAWVRKQTAERIEKIVDRFDPGTVAVIANAVYLKAEWARPFEPSDTADRQFRRADGSTVQVPTMRTQEPLRYASGPGWQAVELPYAGDDLAMWVLVPTGAMPPSRLLSPEVLGAANSTARQAEVELTLPRWNFGTDIDLLPVLAGLGLTDVADLADLSPDAAVSSAVHRANITVDESGTEAAAVTAIMVDAAGPSAPQVTVRADHPFAFAIVHKATAAPLFLGQVADPTAR